MKTLGKLRKINKGILYDIVYRTFLGAALAFYFYEMVNKPLKDQLMFFVGIAVLTVIIERSPKLSFKKWASKVENETLTLFGEDYTLDEIEYIKYEQSSKYKHKLRIKKKEYLAQDIELESPDFIDELRLFKFINQHFASVTMVDELGERQT